MFGAILGWDDVQGQTVDGEWHSLITWSNVDGYPELAPMVTMIVGIPLLVSAGLWFWAPLGGHVGRVLTLLLCGFALYIMLGATEVVPASLGHEGWSSRLLGGTKPRGGLESWNEDLNGPLVAYREIVGYGAGISLWSLVAGLVACVISLGQSLARLGR